MSSRQQPSAGHPTSVPRIGVTIGLEAGPAAGGHVRSWLRLAEAAAADPLLPIRLDLFVIGDEQTKTLSEQVRLISVPARRSTARVPGIRQQAGDTDIARCNPQLAKALAGYQFLLATDRFAFGRTTMAIARRHNIPCGYSIHTDITAFTRHYSLEIIGRLLPAVLRPLAERLADQLARKARRHEDRLIAHGCAGWAANTVDLDRLNQLLGPGRHHRLRRGIDTALFRPRAGARLDLQRQLGLPAGTRIAIFAGRLDGTKGALLAAQAVALLRQRGHGLHLLAAGRGSDDRALHDCLGPHVSLPGTLSPAQLAQCYSGADLLIFPSRSETIGNVILEARASGLPVVLADTPATSQHVACDGKDGMLVRCQTPVGWANAIEPLLGDPTYRLAMGQAAWHHSQRHTPDWSAVLYEDLLPVWLHAINHRPQPHPSRRALAMPATAVIQPAE